MCACGSSPEAPAPSNNDPAPPNGATGNPASSSPAGGNPSPDGGSGGGSGGGGGGGGVAATGTIPLRLVADQGAASNAIVSAGVPFPPGTLKNDTHIVLKDGVGQEVPILVQTLARWPLDGSIRSVLLAFRATLTASATATYPIAYGTARTTQAPTGLAANPDGPVVAMLPPEWYGKSRVSGLLVPTAANTRFSQYESQIESSLWKIDYSAFGNNCGTTSAHRTYYDGPHALWQLYMRAGDAKHYRRAREEALWYRQNELTFYESRSMAVQSCQGAGWSPSVVLDQSVIRRMLAQGMLDDWLLAGDPAAREAVVAMGEAYRRDMPVLTSGSRPPIENTERNLGWTMMGMDSYYALDSRTEVKDGLKSLMDRVIAWQNRGTSGAFEHDIMRADPSECEDGPAGGSPFMTSLLVDGIMDYYTLTADTRVADVVKKIAQWFETKAITTDGLAFRYLWNCTTDPYDDSGVADLNLLIVHVFGAAYALTNDTHWLTFGDKIADSGIEAMFTSRPKQWNQATRSFGRYLGYRSLGAAP